MLSSLVLFAALLTTTPRPAARCASALASLERRWGGTGAWRALAPYPVPREASPTDSVGVWLERWQLDDGAVELRRVSAGETRVASAAEPSCATQIAVHRRTYDADAMAHAFTDERLRALLRDTPRGFLYVWSPGMPLSIRGLDEARRAARTLGVPLTTVVAETRPGDGSRLTTDPTLDALDLVYRDATVHYPAALFYQDGAFAAPVVLGYKTHDTYERLASDAFAGRAPNVPTPAPPAPAFWVDRAARVTTVSTIPTPRPVGFFFKPVGTTGLISYESQSASYLLDLRTRRERRIPGEVDPVPTPDGRFITRPGLRFHPLATLLAGDTTPTFVDTELPDQYQTTSVLSQSRTALRYRIITGWQMGVRLREYDIALARDGTPRSITPLGVAMVPCQDRAFVLPISAKSGREIGVYDRISQTNHVVEVSPDGRCTDRLDLGFASGKVAFSYDGGALAFATARVDVDAEGRLVKPSETFYKDALVLYRKSGRIVSVSDNRGLAGMTFPEFLPDGRVIVLDQASRLRPTEVIRIVAVK